MFILIISVRNNLLDVIRKQINIFDDWILKVQLTIIKCRIKSTDEQSVAKNNTSEVFAKQILFSCSSEKVKYSRHRLIQAKICTD